MQRPDELHLRGNQQSDAQSSVRWSVTQRTTQKEAHFAEVLRYVVLNPMWAKMVERPEDDGLVE